MSKRNNLKKIVGLNSRHDIEDEQLVNFFLLVQAKAKEQGKIFYIDCSEGNIELIGNALAMDLSGWLIDQSDAQEFESYWLEGSDYIPDKFTKFECEEEWYLKDNTICINLITF